MKGVVCNSCSRSADVCCLICDEPPSPFCLPCYQLHEGTKNRGQHYPTPLESYGWSKLRRDGARVKVYKLALNSARLEEIIPPLEGFIKDVECAFEGLKQLLEKWKNHNISALTKCHSALKEQVKAAIAQAARQALNREFETSSDPLENFMLTEGSEMLLLKSQIEKSEAAIAQACIITITSDLCEVEATFRREYCEPEFHVERSKSEETLKAELNQANLRAENLLQQYEEAKNQYNLMEQDYRKLLTKISTLLNVQADDSRTASRALTQSWTVAANRAEELTSELAKQRLAMSNLEQVAATRKNKNQTLHTQIAQMSEDLKNKEELLSALQLKEKEGNSRISKLRETSRKDAEELKKRENTIKELERQLRDFQKQFEMRSTTESEALDEPQEAKSLRNSQSEMLSKTTKLFNVPLRKKQIRLWKCPLCNHGNEYKVENCMSCHQPRSTWKCAECEESSSLLESKCANGHSREAEPAPTTLSPKHPEFIAECLGLNEDTSEPMMLSGKTVKMSPRVKLDFNRKFQHPPKFEESK